MSGCQGCSVAEVSAEKGQSHCGHSSGDSAATCMVAESLLGTCDAPKRGTDVQQEQTVLPCSLGTVGPQAGSVGATLQRHPQNSPRAQPGTYFPEYPTARALLPQKPTARALHPQNPTLRTLLPQNPKPWASHPQKTYSQDLLP